MRFPIIRTKGCFVRLTSVWITEVQLTRTPSVLITRTVLRRFFFNRTPVRIELFCPVNWVSIIRTVWIMDKNLRSNCTDKSYPENELGTGVTGTECSLVKLSLNTSFDKKNVFLFLLL